MTVPEMDASFTSCLRERVWTDVFDQESGWQCGLMLAASTCSAAHPLPSGPNTARTPILPGRLHSDRHCSHSACPAHLQAAHLGARPCVRPGQEGGQVAAHDAQQRGNVDEGELGGRGAGWEVEGVRIWGGQQQLALSLK